ncbi:MAG TPA: hypothetical protein VIS56_02070 [Candidatus Saccharimonadales bacterium]
MEHYFAKGSSGGRGGGFRSSPKSSTSKSTPKTSTPKTPSKPKPSTKPTADAKTTTAQKPKAVTGTNKKYSDTGYKVGDTYQPRFAGYSAPMGSVVYYPQHSFVDYLPWIYLFSQDSPSHDQAAIVQPDGKQVMAEPVRGTDGMAIFNWFLLIVFFVAIIGGIVWLVNKKTQPKLRAAYA